MCLNIIGLSLFAVHLLTADMACITHMHCIAGSSSSQISIEKRTRRHQSRQTAAGDAHDTAVAATSSVSRWQQFATSVQSALYFCLVTCPAGTFSLFACCIVNRYIVCWNVSGMLFVVFFTPPDRGAGYCGDHVSLSVCVCLSVSLQTYFRNCTSNLIKFFCMLPVVVAWSCFASVVMHYLFAVLWLTSCLHIVAMNRQHTVYIQVTQRGGGQQWTAAIDLFVYGVTYDAIQTQSNLFICACHGSCVVFKKCFIGDCMGFFSTGWVVYRCWGSNDVKTLNRKFIPTDLFLSIKICVFVIYYMKCTHLTLTI